MFEHDPREEPDKEPHRREPEEPPSPLRPETYGLPPEIDDDKEAERGSGD